MFLENEFKDLKNVTYLNAAYMGPQPLSASLAAQKAVAAKERPWEVTSDTFFTRNDILRTVVAELLNTEAFHIALISSVSYGVETVVKALSIIKTILVPQNDFPSNIYPWMEYSKKNNLKLKFIEKPEQKTWTEVFLENINSSVGLVSVPQCDWSTGELFNLEQISQKTKDVGAALVVDVSQSFGVRPIDVMAFEPDFLLSVGYKWQLGPYGVSYLYVDKKHLDKMPLENNWISRRNSENFSALTQYTEEYHQGAKRFDSGGRNHFGVPSAIESFSLIKDLGLENIFSHVLKLNELLTEKVKSNGLQIRGSYEGRHMLSIPLPNIDGKKLLENLASEKCYVSLRGNYLRISPHIYNTVNDIDNFVQILSRALK